MTDDESFLPAILQNRDDDTPRLIYADWLEKQGDPRGEFIRLQCASAQRAMALVDPRYWDLYFDGLTLGAKGPRIYDTLCPDLPLEPGRIVQSREIKLARAHVAKWLERFGVGDAPFDLHASITFFRGVASWLNVNAEIIKEIVKSKAWSSQIASVFAIPTLERLAVFLSSDNAGQELVNMMQYGRFRALHIHGPGPMNWYYDPTSLPIDQTIRALANATSSHTLTYLKVSSCWIGLEAFETLVNSPNLDNLRTLAFEGLRHQWDPAGGLPDYYRVIGRGHLQVLLDSRVASRLTSLSLQGHNFGKEVDLLAGTSSLTRLRCLELRGNTLETRQEHALRERWGQGLFLLSDQSREKEEYIKTIGRLSQYNHYFSL
jgi:uncharacterized protein (TIGR02996 family)